MEEKATPTTAPVPLEVNVPNIANAEALEDVKESEADKDGSNGLVEKTPEYITGLKLALVLGCVTFVAFLILLDQSIIATAIPRITSDFHSLPDVGWYGSAYLLASASLQPLTGKIYTYFGSKTTFLTFLGIFELGSLLCGVANSSKMLIVGRAVAGLGSSGLINGALTILAACVPLAKRPTYMGFMMSFAQLGLAIGPLIGGALTQYTTWRWCFYINLPIGGVTAGILLFIHIPDHAIIMHGVPLIDIIRKKLDLLGFAIFAPAAIQFFLSLEWGGTKYAWGNAKIIGLFCGAAGTFVIFLAWEYRKGDNAMVPFSMMRRKVIWSSCIVQLFFFGGVVTFSYYLPIYFQAVKGVSPTLSGVYLLPRILTQILSAVVSGILVSKLGYYLPWAIVSAVFTAIGYGLLSTFTPGSSTGKWVGYQILLGIGRGCGMQMPIVAVQNNIPPANLSVGMAVLVFCQTFGGSLILAVSQTAFTNSLKNALDTYAPNIDVRTLLDAGASAIREKVPLDSLQGVLLAYNKALSNVWYVITGTAAVTFLFTWGMGWKNVKKAKEKKAEVEP